MKALVTGASSGIGYEIAKYLSEIGYDIIAVARNMDRLEKLKSEAGSHVELISVDLGNEQNCKDLFERVGKDDIDIVVNNAGFGLFGDFWETGLDTELHMIRTNITAVHILTKLFLKKMVEKNRGYIMNVGSLTGFMPGPKMATYYATKSYVIRLTQAIWQELNSIRSNVHICLLCPGPVDTRFDQVAGVKFDLKYQTSRYVARVAVDGMFRRKFLIIPGCGPKAIHCLSKISPDGLNAKAAALIQHSYD
jgi:hypothetical protein